MVPVILLVMLWVRHHMLVDVENASVIGVVGNLALNLGSKP